jgi:hypothetical protein
MKFSKSDVVRALKSVKGQFTRGRTYTVAPGSTNNNTKVVADDSGRPNGWHSSCFKRVSKHRQPVPTPSISKWGTDNGYEGGFRYLQIEPPAFAQLLALNELKWTNRKNGSGNFVWGFEDGHIVATNDPLTGTSRLGHQYVIGLADNVGIVGTRAFRDRIVKFLKQNASYSAYHPSRLYV